MVPDSDSPLLTQTDDLLPDSVLDSDAELPFGDATLTNMGDAVASVNSQGKIEKGKFSKVTERNQLLKGRQGRMGDAKATPSPHIGRKLQAQKGKAQDHHQMPSLIRMVFIPEGIDE